MNGGQPQGVAPTEQRTKEISNMSSQTTQGIAGTTAGVAAATAAVLGQRAHAQGSDKIKVGMLGCGGRGNGAIQNCLEADPAGEIIALAGPFEGQVNRNSGS